MMVWKGVELLQASTWLDHCSDMGISLYTGVPDSFLKPLLDELLARYGVQSSHHIVAANEGNAIGLAAGHYLATGHPACVYMQNSGLSNTINPLVSLMDPAVYGIPCLLVIGWRGQPGTKDEPQHVVQGQMTLQQLELMKIPYQVASKATTDTAMQAMLQQAASVMATGRCFALVCEKGSFQNEQTFVLKKPESVLTREDALDTIASVLDQSTVCIGTTGKLSRELFEIRERSGAGHSRDFLTVGSMGHASSIALGMALADPQHTYVCLDGDGAALMHLGALAVIAKKKPVNLIHIVFNNGQHETVGGMPVCEQALQFNPIAASVGYPAVYVAHTTDALKEALHAAVAGKQLAMIEVFCGGEARADLGRPTTTPVQNKQALMAFLQEEHL